MEEVDIPSYFLCPISLQLMQNPVTLPTGITYDRAAIERWLSGSCRTCPVTRQPLDHNLDLTPNLTLLRLIQSWLAIHPNNTTPEPGPAQPITAAKIGILIAEANVPEKQVASLRQLREIAGESDDNRRLIESASGVFDVLASVVTTATATNRAACEETLCILSLLHIQEPTLLGLIANHYNLVQSLTYILQSANTQSRIHATRFLKTITDVAAPARMIGLEEALFVEVVNVIRDGISKRATKAALQVLASLCPWGRNRVKIADANGVSVLVELLLNGTDKHVCELALSVLDRLCTCAEGRAELIKHAAGVPVVSKKVLRVSEMASEKAVRVLRSVARHAATPAVLQEMAQCGVVAKLCLVAHSEQCGVKTNETAHEILRLHARVWRSSHCLSPEFLDLYPSS